MEPAVEKYVDQIPWYFKGEIDYIDGWFLMRTPVPALAILLVYLVFVLKLGPAFMDNRAAFKLKTPLLIYNAVQVLYSAFVFWSAFDRVDFDKLLRKLDNTGFAPNLLDFLRGFSIILKYGLVRRKCMMDVPVVQFATTSAFHYYLIAKVSELLDTVFFVLRKKKNQITFLHVYHHTMMVVATWGMLKYNPTYVIILIGTINSFVHIFMYAYYGLSAFPSLDKYLWWKKYLTAFQLIQFGIMVVHTGIATAVSECTPSYILLFTIFFNVLLMIYLFSNFYSKAYVKKEDNIHVKSKNGQLRSNANEVSHRNNKFS